MIKGYPAKKKTKITPTSSSISAKDIFPSFSTSQVPLDTLSPKIVFTRHLARKGFNIQT